MRGVLEIPDSLLPIQEALLAGLGRVETRFDAQLATDIPPVETLVSHIERYRGKMLRPTLVLLAGLASHPQAVEAIERGTPGELWTDEHFGLGAVVEMVHMATLVHDDVLDEAEMRRRGQTVNRMNDNETAVILGDYLIAAAYHLCSVVQGEEASLAVGDAAMVMAAGELIQLHHRGDWSLDEPTYFEIVQRKTAALISTSCALGAAASGASPDVRQALRTYGDRIGIAFQIQDDVLDLTGDADVVGKSVRRDLAKGKMTLPLIVRLGSASAEDRGRILRLIERASGDDNASSDAAGAIIEDVRASGALDTARSTAQRLIDEALPQLEVLPPSPALDMLRFSTQAVLARKF